MTAVEDGLVQPHWSPTVVEEAVDAIREVRPRLGEERIRRRFAAMDAAFEGASAPGDPASLGARGFPDPGDRHVVAAAVAAGATVVVTANIRDFPEVLMAEFGLAVMSPDEFLLGLLGQEEAAMTAVVVKVAAALRNPERSPGDILAALALAGAPGFAARVRRPGSPASAVLARRRDHCLGVADGAYGSVGGVNARMQP
jgi:hypothetical protein